MIVAWLMVGMGETLALDKGKAHGRLKAGVLLYRLAGDRVLGAGRFAWVKTPAVAVGLLSVGVNSVPPDQKPVVLPALTGPTIQTRLTVYGKTGAPRKIIARSCGMARARQHVTLGNFRVRTASWCW